MYFHSVCAMSWFWTVQNGNFLSDDDYIDYYDGDGDDDDDNDDAFDDDVFYVSLQAGCWLTFNKRYLTTGLKHSYQGVL